MLLMMRLESRAIRRGVILVLAMRMKWRKAVLWALEIVAVYILCRGL